MRAFFEWLIGLFRRDDDLLPPPANTDQLSQHFALHELTRSDTATRHRLDNTPNAEQLENLKQLAQTLEQVRALCGDKAVIISSGFRSDAVNRLVGGSLTSSHAEGLAADFTIPGYGDALAVCRAIAGSAIEFDQLIYEQGKTEWVHLGIGPRRRHQLLSWRSGVGYVPGLVKL